MSGAVGDVSSGALGGAMTRIAESYPVGSGFSRRRGPPEGGHHRGLWSLASAGGAVRLKADTTEDCGVRLQPDLTTEMCGVRLQPDLATEMCGVRLQPDLTTEMCGVRLQPDL